MRSRALQPRSLFRIATSASLSTGGPAVAAASSAASTSSTIATARGSSRQSSHVPPSRSISRTRSRTRSNSTSSSPAVATHTSPTTASRSSGRSSSSSANPVSTSRASSTQAFPPPTYRFSHPVIPVRPPPHSQVSVGLQSFFSQGRPLLEHHNILQGSRGASALSHSGAGAGAGQQAAAMVGVAMMIPAEAEAEGGASSSELEEQAGSTTTTTTTTTSAPPAAGETLLRNQQLPEGVEAQIKAKAQALLERMGALRDELAKASPQERQKMLASVGGSPKDLLPADFKELQQSLSSLTPGVMAFQLHLPALESVPTLAFDRMLKTITSSAEQPSQNNNSPLSLYTQISTLQQFESDRQLSIKQALERGEDPELASALGPESDLVVLGEPDGPRKEWGRGVTSYLARTGRPFCPPGPPATGEEAARVKGLDDLLTYHVSTGEAEMDQDGEFVEVETSSEQGRQSISDLLAEHLGPSSSPSFSSPSHHTASSSSSTGGDPEDLNIWLGHALVQERIKSQLQWDRLVKQMADASLGEAALPQIDVRRLRISLPIRDPREVEEEEGGGGAEVQVPSGTRGRMTIRRRRRGGIITTPTTSTTTISTSSSSTLEEGAESKGSEGEEEGEETVQMDSVRRKRKKKMNKMKYKKLRKRQRAERQRLKK